MPPARSSVSTSSAAARAERRSPARRRAPRGGDRAGAVRTSPGSVRTPDWIVPAVETDQQSETAVLAVADEPPLIAVFTSPHRLQLFNSYGPEAGQKAPDMTGVGRILRTAPGWLAAATDRQILLCDLKRDRSAGSMSAWSSSPTWPSSPTTSGWP